jgi:hypothetical protein
VKKTEEKVVAKPRRLAGHEVLYLGTTEKIAKSAPVAGINLGKDLIYLTDVYPGYFAFYASTNSTDRYGIIEIDLSMLDPNAFLPCEWYLEQRSRKHGKTAAERNKILNTFRRNLERYQNKWRDSLKLLGVCVYADPISKKAIRRVSIYDPAYNPIIAGALAGTRLSLSEHRANLRRNRAVTRWLMGEEITIEDWLGNSGDAMEKKDKENLQESLQSKWGLDLFYHGPTRLG